MIPTKQPSAIFCFFLFFSFFSLSARAQNHPPVYREVLIELPKLSTEKGLNTTVFSLIAMGGIKYEGYCEHMKCLLIKADENLYADNSSIMNKLKELTSSFVIKPSGTIKQVLSNCHDTAIVDNEPEPSYADK